MLVFLCGSTCKSYTTRRESWTSAVGMKNCAARDSFHNFILKIKKSFQTIYYNRLYTRTDVYVGLHYLFIRLWYIYIYIHTLATKCTERHALRFILSFMTEFNIVQLLVLQLPIHSIWPKCSTNSRSSVYLTLLAL